MRKLTTALAGAALVAAVMSAPTISRHEGGRMHECYGHERSRHRGDCRDEHEPQHDGRGSILF